MSGWHCDYEASKTKLIEQVRSLHENDQTWSPTPTAKAYREFADQLEKTANLFYEDRWDFVENEVDRDPPCEIGVDGVPIPLHLSEMRAGYFQGTVIRLREIADTAKRMAAELPNSRKKTALPFAAYGLLYIMYQCEKPRPKLSNVSASVTELNQICNSAGIVLSNEQLRNALSAALKNFTPIISLDGYRYDELLVYSQRVKLSE